MDIFLQQLINGLTLGSIYGLIAIGYTMVFGIIGMVNFAHGDVFMVGTFTGADRLPFADHRARHHIHLPGPCHRSGGGDWPLPGWSAGPSSGSPTGLCAVIPPCADDFRHWHVHPAVQLRAGGPGPAQQGAASDPADVIVVWDSGSYQVTLAYKQILIMVVDGGAAVRLLVAGTEDAARPRPARLRAGSQDGGAARPWTWTGPFPSPLSSRRARGGRRRALPVLLRLVVNFADGFVPGVKAFTAAVLGGIGSLPGAVLGGLLIGLIETFWSAYFSIEYKDVAAFSILAITLVFMPQGLLGRPEVEKV